MERTRCCNFGAGRCVIAADVRLLEGNPIKIDESALTGEFLAVTKNPSDEVFSGPKCEEGE